MQEIILYRIAYCLFLRNSTNDIIIFDAMFGFLDICFKRPRCYVRLS